MESGGRYCADDLLCIVCGEGRGVAKSKMLERCDEKQEALNVVC